MLFLFPHHHVKVCFSVDFMPLDHSRFEIHSGSANLKDEPIRIGDIFPASEKELI